MAGKIEFQQSNSSTVVRVCAVLVWAMAMAMMNLLAWGYSPVPAFRADAGLVWTSSNITRLTRHIPRESQGGGRNGDDAMTMCQIHPGYIIVATGRTWPELVVRRGRIGDCTTM